MASIKLKGDTSGEITIQAPSVAGTNTLNLQASSGTLATTAQASIGTKNLIINGDMRIDQRNAGASVTPTGTTYTVDRWQCSLSQASKFSVQQSTDAPDGFKNSLLFTSLSAYTPVAGDYIYVSQKIEGNMMSHLAWGTSSAKTVTLSFWAKSSLTGTFGGCIRNNDANRSYPFTYTIDSANTWEEKTITITGETTGTWEDGNTNELELFINLGTGSTYSGASGSWSTSNYVSATGSTALVATNSATLYITGVQLEVGTEATPFEHRMYSTELAMCQRYYQYVSFTGTAANSGEMGVAGGFRTEMRTSPTLSIYSTSSVTVASEFTTHTLVRIGSGLVTVGNLTTAFLGTRGLYNIYCTGLASGGIYVGSTYVSAEL